MYEGNHLYNLLKIEVKKIIIVVESRELKESKELKYLWILR